MSEVPLLPVNPTQLLRGAFRVRARLRTPRHGPVCWRQARSISQTSHPHRIWKNKVKTLLAMMSTTQHVLH